MKIFGNFILVYFIAIAAFSHNIKIKEELKKMEQSKEFSSNNISAGFQVESNGLIIDLIKKEYFDDPHRGHCRVVDVGILVLLINAGKEALEGLSELEKIPSSDYDPSAQEKTNNLNYYKSKITTENTSQLNWIAIKDDFKGKNLSYPLICGALSILQKVYKKEYVFLDDSSDRPRFYSALGFSDLGFTYKFGKYMIGSIAKILESEKCRHHDK